MPTAQSVRIAMMAIAIYDYIITIPAEYRFYRSQRRSGRITLSCILFILIRYTSVTLMVVAGVIWFGDLDMGACDDWYILPPVFKAFQAMISQFILGIRTYNLSQRSRWIGGTLLLLYVGTCTLQWVSDIYGNITGQVVFANGIYCHRVSAETEFGNWIHYMVAIIYDSIVTAISFWYLLKYYFTSSSSLISRVTGIMMVDGLSYFVLLTVTNVINMILFRSGAQMQAAAAPLSFVATWIMTQRLLIDLHAATERENGSSYTTYTKTISAAQASRVIRSQPESDKDSEWTEPSLDATSAAECGGAVEQQLDVEVRVERTMRVEEHPWLVERGYCRSRRPEIAWISTGSWATTSHNSKNEPIRGMREPMMVTVK